jgi:hypothetical protein
VNVIIVVTAETGAVGAVVATAVAAAATKAVGEAVTIGMGASTAGTNEQSGQSIVPNMGTLPAAAHNLAWNA